jgi:hypothetical protein
MVPSRHGRRQSTNRQQARNIFISDALHHARLPEGGEFVNNWLATNASDVRAHINESPNNLLIEVRLEFPNRPEADRNRRFILEIGRLKRVRVDDVAPCRNIEMNANAVRASVQIVLA